VTPSNAPITLDTPAAMVASPRGQALSAGMRPPTGTRHGLPMGWVAAGVLGLAGVATAAFFAGQHSAPATAKHGTAHPATHAKQAAAATPTPHQDAGSGSAAPATPVADSNAEPARPAAPVCANCGVVESVQAVQHKGQGSGVGAVAGGVLGGVLGNQMGKGKGRTAMTVLGAIGGGLAGNEVEKRTKAVTLYRVQVRTDAGELRTVEQSTAPAVGERVRVDGQQLHAISP